MTMLKSIHLTSLHQNGGWRASLVREEEFDMCMQFMFTFSIFPGVRYVSPLTEMRIFSYRITGKFGWKPAGIIL